MSRKWQWANALLAVALLWLLAFVGPATTDVVSGRGLDPIRYVVDPFVTLIAFSPLLLVFVGPPLYLFNRSIARTRSRRRERAVVRAPIYFLTGMLACHVLLAVDGKGLPLDRALIAGAITITLSLIFGLLARLPPSPTPRLELWLRRAAEQIKDGAYDLDA